MPRRGIMKFRVLPPLLFCIVFHGNILTQSRRGAAPASEQPQIVYVPVPVNLQAAKPQEIDPLERDKQIDQQLFVHFISILGNFGKILLDPDDKYNVTTNVANMINGIIAVAQTVTKNHRSREEVNRIVEAFIKYLQQQNYFAQKKSIFCAPQ